MCEHSLLLLDANQNTLYKLEQNGLFKYLPHTHSWLKCEITNFGSSYSSILRVRNTAVACADDTIYVYDHRKLLIINIIAGDYKIIKDLPWTRLGGQGIIINNEFHVIGGSENGKHLKWNDGSKTMDIVHDLDNIDLNRIGHQRLIQLKDKVLMFGGFEYRVSNKSDKIYEYDTKDETWKVLDVKLPTKLYGFGCVSVLNDKFIILLGGSKGVNRNTDDIWIYCVGTKTFTKSNIKCPKRDQYHAFVIGDKHKDQMAVFGYIRSEWKISQIDDYLFPPEYLIRIMGRYYLKQEIHLFNYHIAKRGDHWKIDAMDIFV